MKWEIIMIIGFGIILMVGGYFVVKQDVINIEEEKLSGSKQSLKTDTFEKRGSLTKNYTASSERLIIKNGNTLLLDIQLISEPSMTQLISGNDIQVAEFWLNDFKNSSVNVFDAVNTYDKKSNLSILKALRFKYGIDVLNCEDVCTNITTWREFQTVDEIPFKPIRIGIFTNTQVNEHIEWIPSISGFNITEWAEWDVSTAVYNNKNKSVNTQEATPTDLAFSDNGTYAFVVGQAQDRIFRYSMVQPWNVSNATYDNNNFSVLAQDTNMRGMFINSSGTGVILVGQTSQRAYLYILSTPYDLTTATYSNINFSVASQETAPQSVYMNGTGKLLYIVGSGTADDTIFEYDCSTAWNLSTCVYNNHNFSVNNIDGSTFAMFINKSGEGFYTIGIDNDRLGMFSMTAWNITTAVYLNKNLSLNAFDNVPQGIYFNDTGTEFYYVGSGNDTIFQFDIAPAPAGSNCWGTTSSGDLYVPVGCTYYEEGDLLYIP